MDDASTPLPEEAVPPEAGGAEEEIGTRDNEIPDDLPMPPATFEFLVLSLRSQAEMQLGLLHFGPEKDRPKPHLPLARHTIDTMAVLQEKTRGNLSLEESRLLENSLTELRFRFVQVSEETKKAKSS
jgi:hypothetical protein